MSATLRFGSHSHAWCTDGFVVLVACRGGAPRDSAPWTSAKMCVPLLAWLSVLMVLVAGVVVNVDFVLVVLVRDASFMGTASLHQFLTQGQFIQVCCVEPCFV